MNIEQLIHYAREARCSDIHISNSRRPVFRIDGKLVETDYQLTATEKKDIILQMLDEKQKLSLQNGKDIDLSFSLPNGKRQRVNVYRQQGNLSAAIRIISDDIPSFEELKLPEVLKQLVLQPTGLILVTGPTGSGKSTTLAAMLDYINQNKACHIITIEDPVEYVYKQKKAMIHQREVGSDVESFASALRSSLREDPDIILVGEMRDYETISAALTAAETGHLVLSTLHTSGVASTIDRIIDVFPPHNQQQIRTQLAGVLKGVVTQQLLPKTGGEGRVAAFEIMVATDAVLNLIRESKNHQIPSALQTGARAGMVTLDTYLAKLVKSGDVSMEDAVEKTQDKNEFFRHFGM